MKKLITILLILIAIGTNAQNGLEKHKKFFNEQKAEYEKWIETTNISQICKVKDIAIENEKLKLFLQSNFQTDDSLKTAWKSIQKEYQIKNNERIGEKIFDMFTFMFDIGLDSAIIVIQGNEYETSKIQIFHKRNSVRVDEKFPNILAGGTVDVTLKDVKLNPNKTLKTKEDSVSHIRRKLSKFIIDYYKDKGSFWYTAYVDTSRTFYNKFIYRITCLTDEIIKDGYYEYIQFKAEILIQDKAIEVRYDILGKYASGILCPHQRQQFYKSMETYYPDELENYREDMHNRIESFLRGH